MLSNKHEECFCSHGMCCWNKQFWDVNQHDLFLWGVKCECILLSHFYVVNKYSLNNTCLEYHLYHLQIVCNVILLESQNPTFHYWLLLEAQISTDACGNCHAKDPALKDESWPEWRFSCDIWPNVDPVWLLPLLKYSSVSSPLDSAYLVVPIGSIGTWHTVFLG